MHWHWWEFKGGVGESGWWGGRNIPFSLKNISNYKYSYPAIALFSYDIVNHNGAQQLDCIRSLTEIRMSIFLVGIFCHQQYHNKLYDNSHFSYHRNW